MEKDFVTSAFTRLRIKLLSRATFILGNSDDGDDALQEAFFKLWKSRECITSAEQAEKASYVSVRNTAIDMLRRKATHPTQGLESTADLADEKQDSDEETFRIVDNLVKRHLNPRQQAVLRMRDMEGMTYEDIADSLGMTPENVRMTLSRSRKLIRELYRQGRYEK